MSGVTAKQKILEAMERLPTDATMEEPIGRLVVSAKIEPGLADLNAGRGRAYRGKAPAHSVKGDRLGCTSYRGFEAIRGYVTRDSPPSPGLLVEGLVSAVCSGTTEGQSATWASSSGGRPSGLILSRL